MAIHKEIIGNELYVWINGKLSFKRWIKDAYSYVFTNTGTYGKDTHMSITDKGTKINN